MNEVTKILELVGKELDEERSHLYPGLREFFLKGYRVLLPANSPDGKIRGILFCNPGTGGVYPYRFSVHFSEPPDDRVLIVTKNYLDFLVVSKFSRQSGCIPVLTAGPIGLTTLIFSLEGFKVDSPDYGRYIILPVEEQGGLWKRYIDNPGAFPGKLQEMMQEAVELFELKESLRGFV